MMVASAFIDPIFCWFDNQTFHFHTNLYRTADFRPVFRFNNFDFALQSLCPLGPGKGQNQGYKCYECMFQNPTPSSCATSAVNNFRYSTRITLKSYTFGLSYMYEGQRVNVVLRNYFLGPRTIKLYFKFWQLTKVCLPRYRARNH